MRAVILKHHGGLDAIEFVPDYPKPTVGIREVLVEVGAVSVNYHDVFTRRGMDGIKVKLPLITGSDIAGHIVEVGTEVSEWRIGQKILVDPLSQTKLGIIGEICDGGRADFVVVPVEQLIALPDSVSVDEAAALPIAYGTAHRMIFTQGQIKQGETVLLLGASGGVGVAAIQLCKIIGAKVLACTSSEEKARQLRELGAEHAVVAGDGAFMEEVWNIAGKPRVSGSGGVDVAINYTGGRTLIPTQRCVRVGGRILTCGATAGYMAEVDMRYWWTFEQLLIGSNGWSPLDLQRLIDLVAGGALKPCITASLPLAEAAQAEAALETRTSVGKIILKP